MAVFMLGHTALFAVPFSPIRHLHVEGNRILDDQNRPIPPLRGVAIASCEHSNRCNDGALTRDFTELIGNWNVNIVRYGNHDGNWQRQQSQMTAWSDIVIKKAEDMGVYILLDWHAYVGDDASTERAIQFWRTMAPRYADRPNVIYEVMNEPHSVPWSTWARNAERIIDEIRTHAPGKMVVVNGLEWGYQLSGARERPIARKNLVYGSHPYPNKCNRGEACVEGWNRSFGYLLPDYPVLASEWGWHNATAVWGYGTNDNYGRHILDYFHRNNMGYVAWSFSAYGPSLLAGRCMNLSCYEPSTSGALVKEYLNRSPSGVGIAGGAAPQEGVRPEDSRVSISASSRHRTGIYGIDGRAAVRPLPGTWRPWTWTWIER